MHPLWLTFNSGCLEREFLLKQAQRVAPPLRLYLCLFMGIFAAGQYRLARGSERFSALRHVAFYVALCLLIATWAGIAVDFIKRGSVELRSRAVLTVKLLYLPVFATYTHLLWVGVDKESKAPIGISHPHYLDVASSFLVANLGEGFVSVILSYIGLRVHFKTQFFTTIAGIPWNFWNSRILVLYFKVRHPEERDMWWQLIDVFNQFFSLVANIRLPTCQHSLRERHLCQTCILLVCVLTSAVFCLSIVWLLEVIEREKYLMFKAVASSPDEAVEIKKESFLLQSGYTIENVTEGPWLSAMTILIVGYSIMLCGESAILLSDSMGTV